MEAEAPSAQELQRVAEERARCEAMRDYALERSPFVKFMLKALSDAGCAFDARKHFKCVPCDGTVMGGFDPSIGVKLCQNQKLLQEQVTDTITHELVHAYDHCRADVDWNDCLHHACSEIRAANLSGDCFFWKEFRRFNLGVGKQQQVCVKRRALLSVAANKNCTPEQARLAVDAAFEACFHDTAPFERIP